MVCQQNQNFNNEGLIFRQKFALKIYGQWEGSGCLTNVKNCIFLFFYFIKVMLRYVSDEQICYTKNTKIREICIRGTIKWSTEILRFVSIFSKHRPSGPMLSISRNVRLSVCLSVCLFTFEVPFKRLFAPTSWSRMSNIFRDSESLGKSKWKKWSQIWTFLFENCQKSPRKKKFFFADFALQNMVETMLPDGLETSGQRAYC